jgi:hypothetical protein
MATMNFSIPQDVKDAFNATFKRKNKSAIISELMIEAIEREQRWQAHMKAMENISRFGEDNVDDIPTSPIRGPHRLRR